MHPIVRRTASVLAVPALALSALAATSAPASAAADPAPVSAGADWLAGQLTDGVVHNDQYDFDDIGLTADIAFALQAVGGHDDEVDAIVDAVAPRAHDQWYTSTFGGVTTTYAGSLAKAAVLAQLTGADASSFGGQDLVALLEDRVSDAPATLGRVRDENNDFGDTNVIGQAYAAQALDNAGSDAAGSVTEFLLTQQCEGGWFRLNMAEPDATDQGCDDAADSPDTDVTALAVLALQGQDDDTDVAAAIDSAEAWLLAAQRPNGAFGGGPTTEAPNANSTGLAGWALGDLGDTDAAADAAAWLRAHQLANVAHCFYYPPSDLGAVAYDDAARTAAAAGPIDATTQDQFRRATAQALPTLRWAPAATGDTNVLFTSEYVKAGGRKPVGVTGAAPGEALCAMLGEQSVLGHADADGEAHLRVLIPAKTGTSKVKVANADGAVGTALINALGAKKLPVSLKARVAPGKKQVLKLRGLAPGETFQISITWPKKAGSAANTTVVDQANGKGRSTKSVRVLNRPGKAKVKVTGQFANRKNSKTFTVTR